MSAPTVRLCRSGLDLCNGERLPLWSGALHYWRVRRDRWDAALAGVRDLGFGAVETYVPWGVHEVGPREFDFGEHDPQLDLGAFLGAAQGAGLKVIVRPGPHINAELTFLGYPERIVADPAMQAITARGTPAFLPLPPRAFPVPSYASTRFLEEAAGWLRAAARVVRPHLHPAGPVVAVQVDNECALFFRGGPYDLDYHPDAVAGFRTFLQERYHVVEALREAWRQEVDFATALPPREFGAKAAAELVPYLDWVAYKERYAARALGNLAAVLHDEGLGAVPLFHNLPPQDPAAAGLPEIERVLDLCGVDFHNVARDYERIRDRVLYLCGTAALPYAPELGAGAMLYGLAVRPEEQAQVILAVLMHGLRGANVYMAVERERWYGAPLGSDGSLREPLGPFLKRLGAALRETKLFELGRRTVIGVVVPPVYRRLATATQVLDAGPPMVLEMVNLGAAETCREDDFGLQGPVQIEQAQATRAVTRALDRAHLPYVIVDGAADPVKLAHCHVLVCPTFDLIDRDVLQELGYAAEAGVPLLWGPRRPSLDERLLPASAGLPGEPFLTPALLADPDALGAAFASLGLERPFAAREPEVDTTLFEGGAGAARVLFVGTRSPQPLTAHVPLAAGTRLRDLLGDEVLAVAGEGEVAVTLPAYGVRMFAVEAAAAGEVPRV
ncbi:MAG: beta-galactosidase [Deltaproteobacteria bacterium]|nr:beta-galactosidase [Deltaproteobacteria bacterium]